MFFYKGSKRAANCRGNAGCYFLFNANLHLILSLYSIEVLFLLPEPVCLSVFAGEGWVGVCMCRFMSTPFTQKAEFNLDILSQNTVHLWFLFEIF